MTQSRHCADEGANLDHASTHLALLSPRFGRFVDPRNGLRARAHAGHFYRRPKRETCCGGRRWPIREITARAASPHLRGEMDVREHGTGGVEEKNQERGASCDSSGVGRELRLGKILYHWWQWDRYETYSSATALHWSYYRNWWSRTEPNRAELKYGDWPEQSNRRLQPSARGACCFGTLLLLLLMLLLRAS